MRSPGPKIRAPIEHARLKLTCERTSEAWPVFPGRALPGTRSNERGKFLASRVCFSLFSWYVQTTVSRSGQPRGNEAPLSRGSHVHHLNHRIFLSVSSAFLSFRGSAARIRSTKISHIAAAGPLRRPTRDPRSFRNLETGWFGERAAHESRRVAMLPPFHASTTTTTTTRTISHAIGPPRPLWQYITGLVAAHS